MILASEFMMLDDSPTSTAGKIYATSVLMLGSLAAIGVAVITNYVINTVGHIGPTVIMTVLLTDLTVAVSLFLFLSAMAVWWPKVAFWRKWQARNKHHLAIIAVCASMFVFLMIVSGILYALGVL